MFAPPPPPRSTRVTWLSTPHGTDPLLPFFAAGETSAQQILSAIHPHSRREAFFVAQGPAFPLGSPTPNPQLVVAQACAAYANSLYNPAVAPLGRWAPTAPPFSELADTIEPMIAHPFWQQLEVLAAPVILRHRHLPVLTAADLLVRFCNGGDLGIGMVQIGSPDELNPERVAAEAGAAVAMLNDTHDIWPRRGFLLFCAPGKTHVELFNVDGAVGCWLDALHIHRWSKQRLGEQSR
jgi:hypothetical protein